ESAFGRLLLRGGGQGAARLPLCVAELVADHQAEASDVGDLLEPVGDATQGVLELRAAHRRVLDELLVLDDVEGRDGRRAGDGVRAVGAALRAGPGLLHQRAGGGDAREGEARGEALCGDEDVGLRAEVVAAPELAGPSPA